MEKEEKRIKRKQRVRRKISGTHARPRLSVFRSLKHIYAQAVNDSEGKTITCCSSLDKEITEKIKSMPKKDSAFEVGKLIGLRLKSQGIETVVFDSSGYKYHGRVKALADGARASGLKF